VVSHVCEKRFFPHTPVNSREEEGNMLQQREVSESIHEQPLREEPGGKVYSPLSDNKNMLRLLWFVVAMVALLAFAAICLVVVGGTPGWISFIAASFTIMVIASTAISTLK
jgi:hypothetical protein